MCVCAKVPPELTPREEEIVSRLSHYNTGPGNPTSPFIARRWGTLGEVAEKVGVPKEELDALLTKLDRDFLPYDHLMG